MHVKISYVIKIHRKSLKVYSLYWLDHPVVYKWRTFRERSKYQLAVRYVYEMKHRNIYNNYNL